MEKRDLSIDFFKGIGALCIIFIHTVFWSGTGYAPEAMRGVALFFDVPIFIFLSGMCSNYNSKMDKTIKSILSIWEKYLVFLILYFIIFLIIDHKSFSFTYLLNSIFLILSEETKLPVVASSMWYIYMYIPVILIGNFIINKKANNKTSILICLLIYGVSLASKEVIGIYPTIPLFLFIYLLGSVLYKNKISKKKLLILLCTYIGLYLLFYFTKTINISEIQLYKFEYDIKYLFHSLLSLLLILIFKDIIKVKEKNIFVKIGKNALQFYFCQGIASSILILLTDHIKCLWPVKLLICFIINILMTIILVCIYNLLLKLYYKIKGKYLLKVE